MAILCYQGEELELLAERKKKTKRERLGPSAIESLLEAPFALSRLFLREGNGRGGASSKDLSQWLQRPSFFPRCQPSLTWAASLIGGSVEKMPHSAWGPLVAPKQSLCLFIGPQRERLNLKWG